MEKIKTVSDQYGEVELDYVGCLPLILSDKQFERFHEYDTLHPMRSCKTSIVSVKVIDDIIHVYCYLRNRSDYRTVEQWTKKVLKFFSDDEKVIECFNNKTWSRL